MVYWFSVNVATAVFGPSRLIMVQVAVVVPLPEIVPGQVVHAAVEPVEAVAVRTTFEPWSKLALPVLVAG
jgi:hypothetical protein